MSSWESNTIEVNGLHLHYTRTGGDKPPFVMAHGFSDDGLCWTLVAEQLEADYDIIMVDARGHGKSDAPEQGYGSTEHAADLAGVITTLGLQQPLVLGHSMGAATALTLAGTYPDIPGAILLEDPPAWWASPPDASPNAPRQARRHSWITDLKRMTPEEMIALQSAQTPDWSEQELKLWADSKMRLSLNVLNGGGATVDWPATVRRITCPALLITADPTLGAIVTEEQAAALQALVPQVQVAHIPQAGHSIHREQFDRYMQVVQMFLSESTTRS